MAKLDTYVASLKEENARQNLVSTKSLNDVWLRHIADSAQILDHVPRETRTLLDLGSGPGLPGLVLAIMRPELEIVLVESRRKRHEWLEMQRIDLRLGNVTVEGRRVEAVETFCADVITARAFAPLPRLLDLSRRFSTADTLWVLPKGQSAAQDLTKLPQRLRKMFHVEQSMTSSDAGIIVGKVSP